MARHTRPAGAVLISLGVLATGCVPSDHRTVRGDPGLPARAMWLESLDLALMLQDWGSPKAGKSVTDKPLTIGRQSYSHGVGTHANSEWVIDLKGAGERFSAVVGVDADAGNLGSVVFSVSLDDREAWRSEVLRGSHEGVPVSVDLTGASQLMLLVEDAGDGDDHDHADWAGAMVTLVPGATDRPVTIRFPEGSPPQLATGTPPEPVVHAPRIAGATPGRPFLFRVPATGEAPLTFEAENLPAGLSLDPSTGIITGTLPSDGRTDVTLTANGPRGRARSNLTIVGGPDALALTPPMGWNSWNVWGKAVDDAKVRAAADMIVSTGLAAHGYQFVNIDDAWEGARDAEGRIQSNEKFPDMKALADYVHSRGLKLGIYSSPGPKTCAEYEGSYQHEVLDAEQYAAWGIDLLKYDWCSYTQIQNPVGATADQLQAPYRVMREALDRCGRDIVFSLCQYGMGSVWEWGDSVGGNYWRTTGDISDTWLSMSGIAFGQDGHEKHAGPGHWNDPDMLVVGKVGWGPTLRNTRMTPNEQLTHITMWSLLAAPLLIGCDLTQLDDFTLALLTNPEVLEVNQDPLGRQARRISRNGQAEVWARPLAAGTQAVGLFNRGRKEAMVTVVLSDLGLSGPQPIRDLWGRRDVGRFAGAYSTSVPRHGAVMLLVGQPTTPRSPASDEKD